MPFNYSIFKRVYFFILLMVLITAIGTIGYMLIEKWGFVDSIYMTIITMSTVGFKEVHDLSFEGKIFTTFLIITCFGIFAYAISNVTKYIVGGEYKVYLREYRIIKKINKMENHIIICGFGRVGKQVAKDLSKYGRQFIIIERDETVIEEFQKEPNYTFLLGDSTNDETLLNANISKANAIITCLPKDPDNIYVVLAAREINQKFPIIARATESSAVSKLKLAGATNVIMPDSIGGSHMASLVINPAVTEFMDCINTQGHKGVNIDIISFEQLPAEFQNTTIGELDAKRKTGISIIGYKTIGGEYIINPDLDLKIIPNSQLFVLGTPEQIEKMNAFFRLN